MTLDIDLNNEYDIKAVIQMLQSRLRVLEETDIIVPHPRHY